MIRRLIALVTGLLLFSGSSVAFAATGTTTDAAGVTRAQIGESLTRRGDVPWMLLAMLVVAVGVTMIVSKQAAPRPISIRPPKVR